MFEFLLGKKEDDNSIYEYYLDFANKKKVMTELAIEIAVNRIADVIAKCGFQVISKHSDVNEIDYLLNVKPNVNQNATDFWKQAVRLMVIEDDGCIIVNMPNKGMYIGTSWNTDQQVLKEKKYSNVTIDVDGDILTLNRNFKASDVAHLRYSNPKVIRLLKMANTILDELLSVATSGYKMKAPIVKVSVQGAVKLVDASGNVLTSNEYAKKIAQEVSSGDIKSIVQQQGINIDFLDGKSSLSTADIKDLRETIFSNVASAFGIPKNIIFGDVIQQSNNEFITYACEPFMRIIDNALCGAWLTKEEYINGDKIMVDKRCVKHIDVIDSANNLDKLYSNGWSHNDIMKLLGQPVIDEEWADKRRFTKNYAEEGGEEGNAKE